MLQLYEQTQKSIQNITENYKDFQTLQWSRTYTGSHEHVYAIMGHKKYYLLLAYTQALDLNVKDIKTITCI